MGLKCDIVDLPSAGKSTLFNALTKASIETANFPLCTIEPNTGVVPMPDPRLDQLAEIMKPQRAPPATMGFIDIVGLAKGVSKGEGLDNQFLTNIHETEVIGHIVRCFGDDNIIHVSGKVSPADDVEVINTGLVLTDLDTCERAIHRIQKKAKSGDKDAKAELTVLKKCLLQLENIGMLRVLGLNAEEEAAARYLSFPTLKPTMYIVNVSEDGFKNDPCPDQVREIAAREGSVVVPVCAAIEADIVELDDEERDEFMQELGLEEPGLSRVIRTGYKLLSLWAYFTAGVKEVRAWTIPAGTTASQAADKVHTDFEKDFIHAQVVLFEDFITYEGEQGAKEVGKMRTEGRDCIIRDSDVMNFLFNV